MAAIAYLGMLLVDLPAASAQAAPDTVIWQTTCRFKLPDEPRLKCGIFYVLEDRSKPQGRMLQLPVYVLPALDAPAAPDPLAVIVGGGRMSATASLPLYAASRPLRKNRDLVLLEVRGTGVAQPSLTCGGADIEDIPALRRCFAEYTRQGVDLERYDDAHVAADFAHLRQALGYASWNLYGLSQGTFTLWTLLRNASAGVRSAIFDSPFPPNADSYRQIELDLNALGSLFTACSRDTACNSRYPKLQERYNRLTERVARTPVQVAGRKIDAYALHDIVSGAQSNTDRIGRIPAAVDAAARGQWRRFLRLLPPAHRRYPLPVGFPKDRLQAVGPFLSSTCREDVPFRSPPQSPLSLQQRWAKPVVAAARQIWEIQRTACEQAWKVRPAPASFHEPVRSAVATLILYGEFDAITPRAWAELGAQGMARSTVLAVPATGHAVIHRECPTQLMGHFLDNPTGPFDTGCLARMPPIRWALFLPDGLASPNRHHAGFGRAAVGAREIAAGRERARLHEGAFAVGAQ
jgi:pimeloyl-ACP methyl ester carboxylesterase